MLEARRPEPLADALGLGGERDQQRPGDDQQTDARDERRARRETAELRTLRANDGDAGVRLCDRGQLSVPPSSVIRCARPCVKEADRKRGSTG